LKSRQRRSGKTMTVTTQFRTAEPIYFDFALLRKAFLYFALAVL